MRHNVARQIVAGCANKPTMLNLRSLLLLRSVSIGAQVLAILLAIYGFAITLPVIPLLLILSLLSGWTLYSWNTKDEKRNNEAHFFLQLLIDVLALSAIFYFTGGATNPFIWLFLLPIIIAATILPALPNGILALLTILAYSLLMRFYLPLEYAHLDHESGFNQHILGMWFGFIFSAISVAYFINNMARNLRQRDQHLAEAREQQLRDERLVALATLATGAAHELGTPLATMSIITDELFDECDKPELNGQFEIMRQQIQRCKIALSTLSASSGEIRAESGQRIQVKDYLLQIIEQWQVQRPGIHFNHHFQTDKQSAHIIADQALTQALINVLNNAADASPGAVSFHAQWDCNTLELAIKDRGAGLSSLASNKLGKEPYSSKQQGSESGLGLGLFLAHASIKRMGGDITLFNRKRGGVCTRITLPLENFKTLNTP